MLSKVTEKGAFLSETDLSAFIRESFAITEIAGKRILFIIPDSTRSMPLPALFRALFDVVHPQAATMDYIIALGTHPAMSEEAINNLIGVTAEERAGKYADIGIFNHEWKNPEALTSLGSLSSGEFSEISGGLLSESADVKVNKRLLDYDLLCVVGPVFPHEVVGFSGGNKYFFPGVAGEEILNQFHWLGALITNPSINGTKHTPVRAVVDRCAAMIPVPKICFSLNVANKDQCRGIFFGTPEEAWSAAADLAAETHIEYKDRQYDSVLAMAPEMYDEIWLAGKCMYKLEPIVADGGELIIYAPHIDEVSVIHGDVIRKIGYHTRDYFTANMEAYEDVPKGVLAHSTHVRGIGTMENGVEKPRVQVTLATAIPEEECRLINLAYRDPKSINIEDWRNAESDDRLLVERAGEVLYKLK